MPDTYRTEDNENFSAGGTTPTQVNHLIWQGLSGVYLAATPNGLMKSVDGGQTWDYIRPNATFGGDWPAGSIGRQVSFSIGPRECPEETVGELFLLVDEALDTRIYEQGSWVPRALLPLMPYNASGGTISGYGQIVIATRNNTVEVSSDRCVSFTSRSTPIVGEDVDMSGVDRNGVLWAVSETGSDPVWSLWKSEDFGATWIEVQADFEFTLGLAFGASGLLAAWEVSSFVSSIFSGQVRLSDDNGVSFDTIDTPDTVSNGNEFIFPTGVHYLGSGRIALTYVFYDNSASPIFSASIRTAFLDSGAWTAPVTITSLSGSVPGWLVANKTDEIAIGIWDGDGVLEIHTSSDSVTWTELPVVAGISMGGLAYDTNGILRALTTSGLFAYIDGAWEQDSTAPVAYGVLGIPTP